jgi:hypothetical protein
MKAASFLLGMGQMLVEGARSTPISTGLRA